MENRGKYHFADFTEERYRNYIRIAKQRWHFEFYSGAIETKPSTCLWRHDLDLSVDRALNLAEIEKEEGVVATYFVHFHNYFYNAIDAKSVSQIHKIHELGHELGLHFDVFHYQQQGRLMQQSELQKFIILEKNWFQECYGYPCRVISFHNPDNGVILDYSAHSICGMVNATSDFFSKNYEYISDSNGYWRFSRLEDFLNNTVGKPVHVLTHPEWWTKNELSAEERFNSAVRERSEDSIQEYKVRLKTQGRLMPQR